MLPIGKAASAIYIYSKKFPHLEEEKKALKNQII